MHVQKFFNLEIFSTFWTCQSIDDVCQSIDQSFCFKFFSFFKLNQSIDVVCQSIDLSIFFHFLSYVNRLVVCVNRLMLEFFWKIWKIISSLIAPFHHNFSWLKLASFHDQLSDFIFKHCHVMIEGMRSYYK